MSVKSCTVLTVQCQDAEVLTIEGFEQGGALHALQEGFHEQHGLQCGYCTPGMITRAYRLLKENPESVGGGDPLLDGGQSVPLHGLPEHRQGGAARGEEARVGARLSRPPTPIGEFAMAASTDTLERETKLQGMGASRLRKEDARFIRGRGTYVDDIKLPGMLFGAMVRSPYAHARIKSIDKSKALAVPGVVAVLTADDLKPVKLHWMPTLGGDVQAVLADKKVCFQMQEVAMVIASDRYSAADGAELVEVDYEELPAIVDPHKSMAPDAPIIREDIADKDNVGHGKRTHPNHIFTWEAGDKAATDAAFASAEVTVQEEILNPRVHPCPLETCGCVASFDKVTGQLTVYMTSQAPHLVRTVVAMLSGIPESKIRIIGGDIGGGFGNKVPVYPGYVVAIVASIVTGVPIKWIESRIDNISTTGFARDYHGVGELAADKDGRIKALRFTALADHGAFNSHVSATKLPAGLFSICTGSYAIPKAYCRVDAVYTNKAPGGVAYRCSLRVTEAVYLIERMIDVLAQKLGLDKAEIRRRNFVKAEQFPVHDVARLDARQRQLPRRAGQGAEGGRLRRPAPRAGGEAREGRADGHRHLDVHRDRRRRPHQGLRHPRHRAFRQLRHPRQSDRQRDRAARHDEPGPGPRDDLRADHRHRARPFVGRDPDRGRRHRQGALRRRHLGLALDAGRRRGRGHGGAQDPGEGAEDRGAPAGSGRGRSRMGSRPVQGQGQPEPGQDDERDRDGGAHEQPAGRHGEGARRHRILRSAQHDLSRSARMSASSTSTASPARPRCGASMRSTTAARASTR